MTVVPDGTAGQLLREQSIGEHRGLLNLERATNTEIEELREKVKQD